MLHGRSLNPGKRNSRQFSVVPPLGSPWLKNWRSRRELSKFHRQSPSFVRSEPPRKKNDFCTLNAKIASNCSCVRASARRPPFRFAQKVLASCHVKNWLWNSDLTSHQVQAMIQSVDTDGEKTSYFANFYAPILCLIYYVKFANFFHTKEFIKLY